MPQLFSNEVLTEIITSLDIRSDRSAIVSCASASKALKDISQRHLLRTLYLEYEAINVDSVGIVFAEKRASKVATELAKIFGIWPDLGAYTRLIVIQLSGPLTAGLRPGHNGSIPSTSNSPRFSLYEIFERVPNSTGLEISGPFLEWNALEARSKEFFFTAADRIEYLDINPLLGFPISTLGQYRRLSSLRLFDIAWGAPPKSIARSVQLRRLELGPVVVSIKHGLNLPLISSPESPFDFSKLLVLTISDGFYPIATVERLLEACASSLEALEWDVDGKFGGLCLRDIAQLLLKSSLAGLAPDLSKLLKLQDLTLLTTIGCEVSDEENADFVSELFRQSIASRPVTVRRVTLKITVEAPYKDFEKRLRQARWFDLTSFLCNPEAPISCSMALLIRPKCGYVLESTLEQILDEEECLRDLRHRGILAYGTF